MTSDNDQPKFPAKPGRYDVVDHDYAGHSVDPITGQLIHPPCRKENRARTQPGGGVARDMDAWAENL